jgi:uncharacterized repeat protein (TIGR03803 family)
MLAGVIGATAQTVQTLYRFTGSGGLNPNGDLIFDAAGNLYGTTQRGGSACASSSNGCGVVFELSPASSGWTETVLHSFGGVYGEYPSAGVVFDAKGNLYGTTLAGGIYNKGTVFELSPTDSGWKETVLYSFTGATDGDSPVTGVVLDGPGNIYGTVGSGGAYSQGVLFELTQTSGSGWAENVLLDFNNKTGTGPSHLAIDASGNLYGTASTGQADYNYHRGTVYELSPSASGWTTQIVYAFQTVPATGTGPVNGVTIDASGNLYGTTAGAILWFNEGGVVYKLQPPSWTENILERLYRERIAQTFEEVASGRVTLDTLGNVYGAVANVGYGYYTGYPFDGFVFRAGPSGNATYTFPPLPIFERYYPQGGLAVDGVGNVYGTTIPIGNQAVGEVFEITF